MIYDENEPGVFVLYSMKEMKEAARFETDPFFIVHMINAYDDPNDENTVTGSYARQLARGNSGPGQSNLGSLIQL